MKVQVYCWSHTCTHGLHAAQTQFLCLITLSVWQLGCTTALVASLPNSWPVGWGTSSHAMDAKVILGPSYSLSWQQKLQGTTAFFKLWVTLDPSPPLLCHEQSALHLTCGWNGPWSTTLVTKWETKWHPYRPLSCFQGCTPGFSSFIICAKMLRKMK